MFNQENRVNCWDALRATDATTRSERMVVNAKKAVDWVISSQASYVGERRGTTKVQRLGGEETIIRPRVPDTLEGEDIVCSTEKPVEARIKSRAITFCPYTGKLDDLSEHPVKEIIHKVLKNDAKKAFDALAQAQFAATKLRAVATATDAIEFTVNGTATATSSYAMTKEHVKLIVDYMKERNIPAFSGDDYYALARPSTYRTLKNNLESLHQYVDRGFGMIMSGEIGRYEGVRFIEQTNIAVGVGSTAGAGAWDVGKSDTAFFFGEDTVAEAIAIPEEIRAKIPTDFGRSRAIAWLYLGGFGIVHTDATQSRIVMWDSKA